MFVFFLLVYYYLHLQTLNLCFSPALFSWSIYLTLALNVFRWGITRINRTKECHITFKDGSFHFSLISRRSMKLVYSHRVFRRFCRHNVKSIFFPLAITGPRYGKHISESVLLDSRLPFINSPEWEAALFVFLRIVNRSVMGSCDLTCTWRGSDILVSSEWRDFIKMYFMFRVVTFRKTGTAKSGLNWSSLHWECTNLALWASLQHFSSSSLNKGKVYTFGNLLRCKESKIHHVIHGTHWCFESWVNELVTRCPTAQTLTLAKQGQFSDR